MTESEIKAERVGTWRSPRSRWKVSYTNYYGLDRVFFGAFRATARGQAISNLHTEDILQGYHA